MPAFSIRRRTSATRSRGRTTAARSIVRRTGGHYTGPRLTASPLKRLGLRRSATAAGIYVSVAFGFLGTLFAARQLGPDDFGLLAVVVVATGFFQSLLDLTAEEALVKYGFDYTAGESWGRLRRLFRQALAFQGHRRPRGGHRPRRARPGGGLDLRRHRPHVPVPGGRNVAAPPEPRGSGERGAHPPRALRHSCLAARVVDGPADDGARRGRALRRHRGGGGHRRRPGGRDRAARPGRAGRVPPLPRRRPGAARRGSTRHPPLRLPLEPRDGCRVAAQRLGAAPARHRLEAGAGRVLPHRAGAPAGPLVPERAGAADHAHRANARLGARGDGRRAGRRPALYLLGRADDGDCRAACLHPHALARRHALRRRLRGRERRCAARAARSARSSSSSAGRSRCPSRSAGRACASSPTASSRS